jgi:VWFA-related protein
MGFGAFCGLVCFVALVLLGGTRSSGQDQPPRFKSTVDVTSLDVTVVDDHGVPITTLTPADFNVHIDGSLRRVVTAEWVSLVKPEANAPVETMPDGFSTNENSTAGRLIVIAVDEPNIRFGGALAISRAANAFIDRLSPADRIAVAGFGPGAPATVFTANRQRVKQAIAHMVGQRQARQLGDIGYNVSITEALAIERGDTFTLGQVVARECASVGRADPLCPSGVEMQARSMAVDASRDGDSTISGLRDLFRGLRTIEGPKTLVLISEGFIMTDPLLVQQLGAMAAAARTSLYALRLEGPIFDAADARAPIDMIGDRMALTQGLDNLAAATRGTLFTVNNAGASVFQQIESELSGYYLLGVESDPKDTDGKPHPIRVEVPRKGTVVRSRRQLLNTPADDHVARSPHQAVASALASPLLVSALPLRIASFALQGPEKDRVQLLIHADVGADYATSKVASIAYVISDANGRVVENRAFDARLLPIVSGVPSPLQYTAGASLPPGDYMLKLAVVEGDRVGSIEHPIRAVLDSASGETRLSELMVGGPVESGELLQPTIGYQVAFGGVHGYVEAYGSGAEGLAVEYEIAKDADSPAIVDVDVAPHPAGPDRVIFSRVINVQQLPPGRYLLRAVFSNNGRSVKTMTRAFEVAAPKVLMTSADGLSSASTFDTGLFLPVEDEAMKPPFNLEAATHPDTLEPFVARVDKDVKPAFDQGVASLIAGDFPKAETSFKNAINPDTDSTPALAYLATSFAAAGRDIQAASAWQTALVDGTEFPQIYDWLAGALMRTHAYSEARTILEEAVGKWPADVRFTRPLAMIYATFGSGREATRTLERYLDERRDDREACFMAVQWIYLVHAAGAYVHNPAEDVKAAHQYADIYDRAHGTQMPLVKQWLEFLDNERR